MNTPIYSFIKNYAEEKSARFHMPGHKGCGSNLEAFDITEIDGADSLYEASGIIRESEKTRAYFSVRKRFIPPKALPFRFVQCFISQHFMPKKMKKKV